MAEVLAATTAAATSSTFLVTSPVSIFAPGLKADEKIVLEVQYEAGAWYPVSAPNKAGVFGAEDMPKLWVKPGTYRIQKPVTGKAVAISVI